MIMSQMILSPLQKEKKEIRAKNPKKNKDVTLIELDTTVRKRERHSERKEKWPRLKI